MSKQRNLTTSSECAVNTNVRGKRRYFICSCFLPKVYTHTHARVMGEFVLCCITITCTSYLQLFEFTKLKKRKNLTVFFSSRGLWRRFFGPILASRNRTSGITILSRSRQPLSVGYHSFHLNEYRHNKIRYTIDSLPIIASVSFILHPNICTWRKRVEQSCFIVHREKKVRINSFTDKCVYYLCVNHYQVSSNSYIDN